MRRLVLLAALLGLVLLVAGCGGDKGPTHAASTSNGETTTIEVRQTHYGRILVDGRGRALYLFTREGGSTPRCYGACAGAWPVFFASGTVRPGPGASTMLVGTTRRSDGKEQVTYAGHPLYYYVSDRKPGQVTCQNVDEYGGTWLVVSPSGTAIRRS